MRCGSACIDSPLGGPKGQGAAQREGSMLASSSMLSSPTLHEHGRALSVKRRLRWLMAAMTVLNVVLWTVMFGL